jgi:hypothetical protein
MENHEAKSAEQTQGPHTALTAHTPGAWIVEKGETFWLVRRRDWTGLQMFRKTKAEADAACDKENAVFRDKLLRDAAPDMLAALREVEWIFDGKEDITDTGAPNDAMRALYVLRAAIAKATGGA